MATETQFNIDTENAFNQFWGNVIIHGKDEDIRKFEEYVKEIVRNKIGKFVIAAINNKLGILSQNQRHLDIEMDNQTSDFTWPTLKSRLLTSISKRRYLESYEISSFEPLSNKKNFEVFL